jgi:hypothetical protein
MIIVNKLTLETNICLSIRKTAILLTKIILMKILI